MAPCLKKGSFCRRQLDCSRLGGGQLVSVKLKLSAPSATANVIKFRRMWQWRFWRKAGGSATPNPQVNFSERGLARTWRISQRQCWVSRVCDNGPSRCRRLVNKSWLDSRVSFKFRLHKRGVSRVCDNRLSRSCRLLNKPWLNSRLFFLVQRARRGATTKSPSSEVYDLLPLMRYLIIVHRYSSSEQIF